MLQGCLFQSYGDEFAFARVCCAYNFHLFVEGGDVLLRVSFFY